MTTLVALATKDAIVLGSDSLGTVSRPLVDPFPLARFFDLKTLKPKKDKNGEPLINLSDIVGGIKQVPYDHMTHVDKILPLGSLSIGVMFAGIASIQDRTIKSLIKEFADKLEKGGEKTRKDVDGVAKKLKTFIKKKYMAEYGNIPEEARPPSELIVSGYNATSPTPRIYRIAVHEDSIRRELVDFGIVFGGQMVEIQRLVFGIDTNSRIRIEKRYMQLLENFVAELRAANGQAKIKVPDVASYIKSKHIFGRANLSDPKEKSAWDLEGMSANWGDFSEQNAIDCVDFFVSIMCQAQRFNSRMPTVGGEIHVALVTKDEGFKPISREEYRHGQHAVAREHGGGRP